MRRKKRTDNQENSLKFSEEFCAKILSMGHFSTAFLNLWVVDRFDWVTKHYWIKIIIIITITVDIIIIYFNGILSHFVFHRLQLIT